MKEYKTKDFIKLFERHGWELKSKGSHFKYVKQGFELTISIPVHGKTISLPLARRLLKEANIKD